MSTDIAELIESGVEIIRENGWYQGDLWPDCERRGWELGAPVCAVGSMVVASNSDASDWCPLVEEARGFLNAYVSRHRGPSQTIIGFNDGASRAEDVIDVMIEAAKELRNAG